MKTTHDPRHLKRKRVMQDLFTWEFNKEEELKTDTSQKIIKNLPTIDKHIKDSATAWPLEQINKVDLAILRLAVFELIIEKDVPFRVITDEAVELAKEFGSESSPSFVNGVLGSLITINKLEEHTEDNL
ncbi:MAG: transcription antitermination factor NusB [Armatimonadetes bacterium]|nr:MAG: transcription antitermination factor NusB [Armatimonadota bacterium]